MNDSTILQLIRHILLTEAVDSYKPEAPIDAPLGKYAFADASNRHWARSPLPPYEQNTTDEEGLRLQLVSHFRNNLPIPQETVNQIKEFIRAGLYSDIFAEPPAATIYRGIHFVGSSSIKSVLPNIDIEKIPFVNMPDTIGNMNYRANLDAIDKRMKKLNMKIDITNRGGKYTTSWTKALSTAVKFSLKNAVEDDICIVFCAKIENNPGKFIDCEGLYRLREISSYDYEEEVIGTGTIQVNSVLVCRIREDSYDDE